MAKSVAAALYAWFFACLVGCASVNSVPPQNDLQYLASWRDKKAIAFLNTEAFSSSDPLYWRLPNGGSRPPTLSNSFQSEIDEIVRQLSETPIIGKSDFVVVGSDCSGYGARALMNGRIEVCRNVMYEVESRSELAFLVCHEIGHLVLGDLAKERVNNIKERIDGKESDFNRRREVLADLVGVDICANAGFDPYLSYYALLKQKSQNLSPRLGAGGILIFVDPTSNQNLMSRADLARGYLRHHYSNRSYTVRGGDAFLYYSVDEQKALSAAYASFLQLSDELRAAKSSFDPTGNVVRDERCANIGNDFGQIGNEMQYDREWIGVIIAYGLVCGKFANAAAMIELATKTDHAHGDMHVVVSILYSAASSAAKTTQARLSYQELALSHYRKAMDQNLYEKPYPLNIAYLAYGLSGGDQSRYADLKAEFMEYCGEFPPAQPQLEYGYWCRDGSAWRNAFSISESGVKT